MLHETRYNPTTVGLSNSSGGVPRQLSTVSVSSTNAGSGRGGNGNDGGSGTFFATDPSNPLNTRYFHSCRKSVELYLNALRRGHDKQHQQQAAAEASSSLRSSSSDDRKGDRSRMSGDKDNEKNDDNDDDDISPLVMPEDTFVDTAVLDHQVLEEITGHIDALKDLCSGPDAAFLTIDKSQNSHDNDDDDDDGVSENKKTSEETYHSKGKEKKGTSSDRAVPSGRKMNCLDVRQLGGGENVLTNASATFTLEQQMLQEAYRREIEEESDKEESEDEGKGKEVQKEQRTDIASSQQSKSNPNNNILEESRRLLTKSIVQTIAGLDPMDVCTPPSSSSSSCSSSEAERIESILASIGAQITDCTSTSNGTGSGDCGGGGEEEEIAVIGGRGSISIVNVCEMFDTAMMKTAGQGQGSSCDKNNNTNKTETTSTTEASSRTLEEEEEEEERRLLAFFEREDPPESDSLMESQLFKVVGSMVRFAATVATHTVQFALQYPDVSVSSSSSSPTTVDTTAAVENSNNNNNSNNSPVVLASSSSLAAPCSPHQLNESQIAASSSLSFSQSGGGGGVTAMKKRSPHPSPPRHMNRHSSAIFDDCPSVRENLSEFTAQLLYHAMSILCESMSVFKGSSEQDRVIEMIEFYVDRCESILLASVLASSRHTSAAACENIKNNSISAKSKRNSSAAAAKTHIIGSLAPIRLTFRQQCVIAARRSVCLFLLRKVYPFRRRVQNLMVERRDLGGTHHSKNMSRRSGGAASRTRTATPAVDIIGSHLNLVFGRVSRPIELTWFAEGFRSIHMQLMANLSQNNRLVARALTNAPLYRDAFSLPRKEGGGAAKEEEEEVAKIEKKSERSGEAESGKGGKPCAYTAFARESVANNGIKSYATHEGKVAGPSTAAAAAAVAPPDLFCSILQSTGLDPENPAIAEWSEFCVKCMCSVSLSCRMKLEGLKKLITSSSPQEGDAGGKYSYIHTMETKEDADADTCEDGHDGNTSTQGSATTEVNIFMKKDEASEKTQAAVAGGESLSSSSSCSPIEGSRAVAAQSSAQQPNCYTPSALLSPSAGNGNFASINGITERLDTWEQYEEAFM